MLSRQEQPDAKGGSRAWRAVLGSLIAIPAIAGALWGVAAAIAWAIPGCEFGGHPRSCVVGGIDFDVLLARMTMPAAFIFFSIVFPLWMVFTVLWVLYGLVSAAVSWAIGRSFAVPPASVLQGSAMRVPRIVFGLIIASLFAWWWIATL